jgi:hypothetical protein
MYFVPGKGVPLPCFAPNPIAHRRLNWAVWLGASRNFAVWLGACLNRAVWLGACRNVAMWLRAVKNKRVAKYIHPGDKWMALRTNLREATLRVERVVRA